MNAETATSWRVNLALAGGVIFTVILGLFMAQLDYLQTRLAPTAPSAARVTSTIASDRALAAIILPTTTSSLPSPTALIGFTETETAVPTAQLECGAIPLGWVSYIVQYNDTPFSLALDTGTTQEKIIEVNCLGMSSLMAGMRIYLPKAPPVRIVCGPPPGWVRYTVQQGDTLYSLAYTRGTSVWAIQSANCFFGQTLFWGRQIYLPALPPTATWTPTIPPSPTATATAVPTIAATATHTPPPIPTLTVTVTPGPTMTATAVITTTMTATFTPGPTATATETPAFTPTPTQDPGLIPTPTGTPVPPTATFTPLPTAVNTPVPTPNSP